MSNNAEKISLEIKLESDSNKYEEEAKTHFKILEKSMKIVPSHNILNISIMDDNKKPVLTLNFERTSDMEWEFANSKAFIKEFPMDFIYGVVFHGLYYGKKYTLNEISENIILISTRNFGNKYKKISIEIDKQ